MVNQVQLFAPLEGLIDKVRKGLTEHTPMRDITKKIETSGLNAFLEKSILRYTGLSGAVFIASDSMRPSAETSIMYYRTKDSDPTRHDNAMMIIRKYGASMANMATPAIRDLFNLTRGHQTRSVQGLPTRDSFRIYIRITKGLLVPDSLGNFRFTSREVAGIICHEIGHTVWNVTASDQILFADTTFSQSIAFIKSHPPVSEVKKILDLIYKDSLYPTPLKTTIEALRRLSVSDGDADYLNYCEIAVWVIMAVSGSTKKATIDRFWYRPADRYTGANTETAIERFCDSFSGQCGYGADLASALSKYSEYHYAPSSIQRKTGMDSAGAFLTAVLNPYDEAAWGKYDSIYDRMKDSIYATKQSLTQDDLSSEEKTQILEAISRGERIYAEYISRPYVKLRHVFFNIQSALGAIKTFSPSAFGHVLETTFSEFHDALQIYNSGEMAYYASLLETQ